MKASPLLAAALLCAATAVNAQFIPNTVAVLRIGSGSTVPSSGAPVFVDQYTTNSGGGTLVNSVALPASGTTALIIGSAASDGFMGRAGNGRSVIIAGYNTTAPYSSSLANSTSAAVPRAIATVDYTGTYVFVTNSTTAFSANNMRSGATDGASNFWATGPGGVIYWGLNAVTNTVQAQNCEMVGVFNGNLWYSSQKTSTIGVYEFSGLPESAATPVLKLTPPNGANALSQAFVVSPDGNTAYIADGNTTVAKNGGIQKFTFNGSTWSSAYTITVTNIGTATGARGVAADFSGAQPVVYATTMDATANRLVSFVDTGSASGAAITETILATAAANEIFDTVQTSPAGIAPSISAQPQPETILSGANASFSVTASGSTNLNYQWSLNSSPLSGATSSSLTLSGATSANAGSYQVVVTNIWGAATSSVAVLTVNASATPPSISAQPQNESILLAATATFSVTASGTAPLVYQWTSNNVNLTDGGRVSGSTNDTLTITDAQLTDDGSYAVIITNSANSITSSMATLTVNLPPPPSVSNPSSQTVQTGFNAVFTSTVSGATPLTYQWTSNNVNLTDGGRVSGSSSTALTISSVVSTDAGSYAITATNPGGPTTSQPAVLTVPLPSSVSYSTPGGTYTQNFDSLPNPGTVSTNSANPTSIAGTNYSLGTPFDFAFQAESSGNGGLGLSGTMPGWYGSAAVSMKLGATAGDQTTGGILSFGPTNSTGAATDRSLGLLATSTTGGTAFGVRLVNNTGGTLNVFNLSYTSELWRETTTAKTIANFYYLDTTGTAAFSTNNITGALTNLTFATGSTAWGTNGPVATSNIVVNQTLTWGAGQALWVVWQMADPSGSGQGIGIDDLSFSALSYAAPVITVVPQNQSTTLAQTATFTAEATGFPQPAYQWSSNSVALTDGSRVSGSSSLNLTISDVQYTDDATYTLTATNAQGNTSASATLTVIAPVPPTVSNPASETVQTGYTANFSSTVTGTGPVTYQWTYNNVNLTDGGRINGSSSTALTISNVVRGDSGSYAITATNPGGPNTSQAAVLTVPVPSSVSYSTPGAAYTQDFDSLPNPGIASTNTANPTSIAGTNYSLGTSFDFAFQAQSTGNGGLGLAETMSGWYGSANASMKLGATAGDQTTGGILSFGPTNSTTAATNRSLGLLATGGTGGTAFGVKFVNNTGQTLNDFNLAFTSELWRETTTPKTISVFYYIDTTGTAAFSTNSSSGALTNLSFTTKSTEWGTNGPVATSNIALNRSTTWGAGQALWVVWEMADPTGSGQGIGIDDLSFNADYVAPASIGTGPANEYVNYNATANFNVNATGDALTYQWQFNGANLSDGSGIAGSQTASLTVANASFLNDGTYNVIVYNQVATNSASATLSVADPYITSQLAGATVQCGSTPVLGVGASGSGTLTYQWYSGATALSDAGGISGSATPSLTLGNIALAASGNSYSVVATGAYGSVTSAVAVLTVEDTNAPVVSVTPGQTTIECPASYTEAGATENDTCAGAGLSVTTLGSVNAGAPGTYTVTYIATDPSGNSGTNTRVVVVQDTTAPVITELGFSPTNWSQHTAFVDAGATANDTCAGSVSVTTTGSVDTTTTGTYSLTYSAVDPSTNPATSETRIVVVITDVPPVVTTPAANVVTNYASTAVLTATVSGPDLTYYWRFATNSHPVKLSDGGNISGSSTASLTIANLTHLNVGSYSLVITNPAASVTSAVATLKVVQPVITTNPVAGATNNTGTDDTVFTVAAIGDGTLHYQWYSTKGSGTPTMLAGKTAASLTLNLTATNQQLGYYAIVNNSYGKATSTVAQLIVYGVPTITTQPAKLQTPVAGNNVSFTVKAAGTAPLSYQWNFDGAPIYGATLTSYSLINAQAPNNGSYSCTVSNISGVLTTTTNTRGILALVPDTNKPTVSVSGPTVKILTNEVAYGGGLVAPTFAMAGEAKDLGLVTNIVIQRIFPTVDDPINAATNELAPGAVTYSNILTLANGTNIYDVWAVNSGGVSSKTNVVKLFFLNDSVLTIVTTNGTGVGITTNVTAASAVYGTAQSGQEIALTRNFTVKAIPGPNSIFTNWTDTNGNVLTTNVNYTFTMTPNLTLNANFLTNPIVAAGVAGSYNGLFYNDTTIVQESSGFIGTCVVKTNRTYTGTLKQGGFSYTLAGTFDLSGNSTATIVRTSHGESNLTVTLNLDWSGANNGITGTVTDLFDGWSASLQADKATNVLGVTAQKYTMIIPPGAGAPDTTPGGYGYASVTNSAAGVATFAGTLADGTTFSPSEPLAADGSVPLYATPYGNAGLLIGWLDITETAISGTVTWIKPTTNKPATYPNGFTNTVEVSGAVYSPATPAITLASGTLTITDADITGIPLTYNVAVSNNNMIVKIPGGATNKLSGSITKGTGIFTVTYQPTGSSVAHEKTATGIVTQSSNSGVGTAIGTNTVGSIDLH